MSLDSPRSAQPAWAGSSAGQDWFCFFEAARNPSKKQVQRSLENFSKTANDCVSS